MSDIGLATALHVVSTFSSFLVETGRSSAVASLFMSFMGEFYTNIDRVSDVSRFASFGYRLVRIIASNFHPPNKQLYRATSTSSSTGARGGLASDLTRPLLVVSGTRGHPRQRDTPP